MARGVRGVRVVSATTAVVVAVIAAVASLGGAITVEVSRRRSASARRGADDAFYLYRVEQRAIGELMIVENPARTGPARACLGYAAFVDRLADESFARWFTRFGDLVEGMPAAVPQRVVTLQHALVDLLDALDPDGVRVGGPRSRIPGRTVSG